MHFKDLRQQQQKEEFALQNDRVHTEVLYGVIDFSCLLIKFIGTHPQASTSAARFAAGH